MGFPFSDHIILLGEFVSGRQEIVDRLERELFGAKGKAAARNGDRESIADVFNACCSESGTRSRPAYLQAQLAAAHVADGFEPVLHDGYARGLDPVELVLRACHYWDQERWPGRNGRIVYAQSLYLVFILRQLEHLSLRIWDEGLDGPSSIVHRPSSNNAQATERLQHLQRLLDLLNGNGSAGALRLVRDARWLIQTAQGPLTRHLKPYFVTAAKVAGSFPDSDRLEIHKAGIVLAGGHLRSQVRHRSWQTGRGFDDPLVLAMTRSSSSMDIALLVRDLVPVLDAYLAACARQDGHQRLALADAILQGLSTDPELLLTRLDLLAPSTMVEDLFIDDSHLGAAPYTEMGEVHRTCLTRYSELIGRAAELLRQDAAVLDPSRAAYSPLGGVYGFCADLVSNMVLSTLRSTPSSGLSLEDMFVSNDRLEEKRALAHEWERLPKGEGERDPFEYSTDWAVQMFSRMTASLEARAGRPGEPNASNVRKSLLYVVQKGVTTDAISVGTLPAGIVSAQEHCLTSDVTRARATGATVFPASRMSADRAEGRFLACANSEGIWFGVSKVVLTMCTSQGKDALLTDVPRAVVEGLRLTCPELLVVIDQA